MKRIGLTIVSALAMLSVASVGSASAATEVGNDCTANQASGSPTLLQLAKGSGSPPITVPEAGVVTKWKVNVIPFEGSIPTTLRVFRATGGANEFITVAESAVGSVVAGSNSFDTRISVEAGVRFGNFGGGLGTLYCSTENPADKMGLFEGNAEVGQTQTYNELPGTQVAISATVEPDADKDGYGDETRTSAHRALPCRTSARSSPWAPTGSR